MVESAPLSQQDSEQPSETTEPTQVGGTEPVEEAMNLNEVDVNQFSQAFKAPEIEMPIAAVGVNPISDNQNQNVVKPVQNQVTETQQDLDHPVSFFVHLADPVSDPDQFVRKTNQYMESKYQVGLEKQN